MARALTFVAVALWAGLSAAQTTEFRYQVVNDSTLKIGFWNNAYFSKARAQDLVFEKIANLAIKQGAKYFELVQPQVSTDYVATSSKDENGASGSQLVKTNIGQPPAASREWNRNGTIVFPRYFFTAQVKLYKTAPAQADNKVYFARNVAMRQQYIVKPFATVKHNSMAQTNTASTDSQSGNGARSGGVVVSKQVADWTNKSYDHLQKNEWAEAIRTASAAINLNKAFDVPYVNRATAYIQHGYMEKASNDIDTALALNPDNALAINMKGYLYQQGGDMFL